LAGILGDGESVVRNIRIVDGAMTMLEIALGISREGELRRLSRELVNITLIMHILSF